MFICTAECDHKKKSTVFFLFDYLLYQSFYPGKSVSLLRIIGGISLRPGKVRIPACFSEEIYLPPFRCI